MLGGSLADDAATAGRAVAGGRHARPGHRRSTRPEQIAQYFDSIGGQIRRSVPAATRIFGSATTLREDFPQAAALFAECFTRPTFPAGRFAKAQAARLGRHRRAGRRPARRKFRILLRHPARRLSLSRDRRAARRKTVERLTADDLRAVPRPLLRAGQHDRHGLRRHRAGRSAGLGRKNVRRAEAGSPIFRPHRLPPQQRARRADRPPQGDRQADGHDRAGLSGGRASSTRKTMRR